MDVNACCACVIRIRDQFDESDVRFRNYVPSVILQEAFSENQRKFRMSDLRSRHECLYSVDW